MVQEFGRAAGPATEMAADEPWQPRIAALVCNWCTYAGADMAGTTRRAYPASVRAIRLPCTGRIDPLVIVKAFAQGADGVLVSGCHPGDCHYVQGNYVARRRFAAFRTLVDFLGLDPRRLHFAWVSASEGMKWAGLVEEVTAAVRAAGPFEGWGVVPDGRRTVVQLPAAPAAPRAAPDMAGQQAVAAHLQGLAATLLAERRASLVIGYTAGSLPGQMVPVFIDHAEDAGRLGWSDRCFSNLSVYLPDAVRRADSVGVVVKRCDTRTVVGLVQEHQLPREKVVLIGVSCPGVWERGSLAAKCHACDGETAPGTEFTVTPAGVQPGAVASGAVRPVGSDPRDVLVAHLESLSREDRWGFWQAQFAECLRCYGCRAVCPMCYCAVCVADKNRPQWIPTAIDGPGNVTWNVTRAVHQVGRCTGCDECARVCPAGVRLDLLNHRLAMEVATRFGYRAGEDPAASPPLGTFRPDDRQEFIH